jgi:hypothetical protein
MQTVMKELNVEETQHRLIIVVLLASKLAIILVRVVQDSPHHISDSRMVITKALVESSIQALPIIHSIDPFFGRIGWVIARVGMPDGGYTFTELPRSILVFL